MEVRSNHHHHRDDEPVISVTGHEPRPPSPTATTHSRGQNRVERDALELHQIETQLDNEFGSSTASISSGEYRITTRRTASRTSQRTERSQAPRKGLLGKVQRFWTRNVVLTVPQKSNRDHFGKLITFSIPPLLYRLDLNYSRATLLDLSLPAFLNLSPCYFLIIRGAPSNDASPGADIPRLYPDISYHSDARRTNRPALSPSTTAFPH